jgi:membrane fusion protein, multidrug efflux system
MVEETGVDTQEQDGKPARWMFWGGGAVVAVIVGVAALSNSSNTNWSDNKAGQNANQNAGTPVADGAKTEAVKPKAISEPDIRGVIKAKQESTVASKMTARIIAMPFDKGRSFRRGALLASFDCSTIRAQLNAANAAANAYRASYKTNVELDQYEAVGKNEVAVSKANLGKAQAEAAAVGAQLSDCAVYAPFSGTVVEQIAHRGEVAASGQPLLKIQSGGDLEIELIVPSNWLTWMRPGASFTFKIDETGSSVTGVITQLGASVDPVSKTIRVTGNVGQTEGLVLPGMSGTAVFDKQGVAVPADTQAITPPPSAGAANGRKPS